MPLSLDYNSNVYLAVSLTPTSILKSTPIQLNSYPSIVEDLGSMDNLPDVKLLSIPKDDWSNVGEDILKALRDDRVNILRVDEQKPKLRAKRGGDEL
ncbi:hypothetical protein ACEPAF_5281 [Sanghuangporus sanghuang]